MKNENVETQVKKFNEYEAAIEAVKPHAELVINGIEDKEGAKVVSAARIECKKLLAKIENDRKDIKAPFLEACKTIDTKAKEYKESVQEVKTHLENEEAKIAAELQKIEDEKAAAIKAEIERRIALILTCDVLFTGFSYQLGSVQIMQTEIETLSNEDFDEKFNELKVVDNELKEAARVKAEAEKAEAERLRVEREAQEKRAAELEAKEREAEKREAELKTKEEAVEKAEALRVKVEADRKEAAEKAEKEKVEVKRNAELKPYITFIRDYSKMLAMPEKEYQAEFAEIKQGAADHYEYERKNQIEEAKKQEAERLKDEQEAKKKAEADKLAAEEKAARLAPDKEKLEALKDSVIAIQLPEMKTKEGKEAIAKIQDQFDKMAAWLVSVAETL